jgi:hypothetical protein
VKRRTYLNMVIAVAILLPGISLAQPGRDRGRDHGRGGSPRIGRVVADCAARASEFRVSLRRALNRSGLDGTNREDELNTQAARLERSMQRVNDDWNGYHDAHRTRAHVSRAIDAAQDINRTMLRRRMNPRVQEEWRGVRRELNMLAEVFELPKLAW